MKLLLLLSAAAGFPSNDDPPFDAYCLLHEKRVLIYSGVKYKKTYKAKMFKGFVNCKFHFTKICEKALFNISCELLIPAG